MIGGLYTVAELRDLISAKEVELKALSNAIDSFDASWKVSDPIAEAQWRVDYQAMLARYRLAWGEAEATIGLADLSPIPDNGNPADAQYRDVLTSLQRVDGQVNPGDFQDLWNRLVTAQGAPIPEPPVPQPSSGSDLDLTWYQKLDKSLPSNTGLIGIGVVLAAVAALAYAHNSTTILVKESK